ncbi:MAG TPA: PEP-CTERM sorting domain-containing protein [Sedimentisphaerales bacterium]|nr:PEP-CTERM sorting domain-containing protein [Sedimentisphaerales bacterium]
MKKLLVLMLVFGLASAANAATVNLEVTVGGNPYGGETLAVGTVVKVQIVQSGPDVSGNGGTITVDFLGANPTITDTTPVAVFKPGPPMTMYGWTWTMNGGVSMLGDATGYTAWKAAAASLGVGTPGIGSLMDPMNATMYSSTYEFTFEATETMTLTWGAGTTWDNYDQTVDVGPAETVNVVPEPMTIALLGLGGLFLRRRK